MPDVNPGVSLGAALDLLGEEGRSVLVSIENKSRETSEGALARFLERSGIGRERF